MRHTHFYADGSTLTHTHSHAGAHRHTESDCNSRDAGGVQRGAAANEPS